MHVEGRMNRYRALALFVLLGRVVSLSCIAIIVKYLVYGMVLS